MGERFSLWGAARPLVRRLWYLLFRRPPYYYAGAFYWTAMSASERTRFQATRFNSDAPRGWRENCLRAYLDGRYYARATHSPTLTPENRERWAGPSALEYHQATLEHYQEHPEEFQANHGRLLDLLKELLSAADYQYVVEIGCGNGLLLERVAALAPPETVAIGLDMNPDTVAANRQRYAHSRVQFHRITTVQEFLQRLAPQSVLVYGNSTFAFFTPLELLECFRWLRTNVPRGAVAVAEATFLDPALSPTSLPLDGYAFRHNYERVLRDAGFECVHTRLQRFPESGTSHIVASVTWDASGSKPSPHLLDEAPTPKPPA